MILDNERIVSLMSFLEKDPQTAAQFNQQSYDTGQNQPPVGKGRQILGKVVKGAGVVAPFCFFPPVAAGLGLTGATAAAVDIAATVAGGSLIKHEANHVGNAIEGNAKDQSLTANLARGAARHPILTTGVAVGAMRHQLPKRGAIVAARGVGTTLSKVSEGLSALVADGGEKGFMNTLVKAGAKGAAKGAEALL